MNLDEWKERSMELYKALSELNKAFDAERKMMEGEIKKICEEQLKEIEPNNPRTTWTEEKLFINTYGFR